jgi:hypothetical protein
MLPFYILSTLVVVEIRKTSPLPKIKDVAINAMLGLTQGFLSHANYS